MKRKEKAPLAERHSHVVPCALSPTGAHELSFGLGPKGELLFATCGCDGADEKAADAAARLGGACCLAAKRRALAWLRGEGSTRDVERGARLESVLSPAAARANATRNVHRARKPAEEKLPAGWGERREALYRVLGTKHAAAAAGISVKVTMADGYDDSRKALLRLGGRYYRKGSSECVADPVVGTLRQVPGGNFRWVLDEERVRQHAKYMYADAGDKQCEACAAAYGKGGEHDKGGSAHRRLARHADAVAACARRAVAALNAEQRRRV